MRTLIVGAGAVGGYFGGRLLQAGRDVTFLVRERRAEELKRDGLIIKSPLGDVAILNPPTVTAGAISAPFDLILLSCKAYDLDSAIAAFAPAVGPQTMILPVINGLRHLDVLAERFGEDRVLGGHCIIAATLDAQRAIVHLNDSHILTFGERVGGSSERISKLAAELGGAGFDANASAEILQEMWEKWVMLASLASSTTLMRGSVGAILSAPRGSEIINGLRDECIAIAAANGHAPRAAALQRMTAILSTPNSPMTASMFRDIENGAPIEADHVIGDLIARRGNGKADRAQLGLLDVAYAHLKTYEHRQHMQNSRP